MATTSNHYARDAREAARSFVAGGLYSAGIAAIGIVVASSVSNAMLPALTQSLEVPPKYVANQLDRAERWNPDQWKFESEQSPEIREALAKTPDLELSVQNAHVKLAEAGEN